VLKLPLNAQYLNLEKKQRLMDFNSVFTVLVLEKTFTNVDHSPLMSNGLVMMMPSVLLPNLEEPVVFVILVMMVLVETEPADQLTLVLLIVIFAHLAQEDNVTTLPLENTTVLAVLVTSQLMVVVKQLD
jgi:hypothetical protein